MCVSAWVFLGFFFFAALIRPWLSEEGAQRDSSARILLLKQEEQEDEGVPGVQGVQEIGRV